MQVFAFRTLVLAAGLAAGGVAADAVAQEPPPPEPEAPVVPPPPPTPTSRNYLNFSMDALMAVGTSTETDIEALQPGGHDPSQRGFTLQGVELVLEGAVDPYFRAQSNLVFLLTPEGETEVELEEVYATTSSLPHNLQVKAGQFLSEFGRLNPTHPHTWDFVDQPLVSGRMFGADGLRSVGARLSWLMPVAVYSEFMIALQNARGETATSFGGVAGDTQFGRPIDPGIVRSGSDMLLVPRYSLSLDIGETQTLLMGLSGAYGPNGTGPDANTRIHGLDIFWKWKSPRADKGFPFVKVQAEAMARRYEAAATATLPEAVFEDHGAYLQAVWGVKPRWTVGARYDTTGGDVGDDPTDPRFEARRRAALQGSWYPSEYSKLRLQYARDWRPDSGDADSIWLQLEFLLGAHAAHKF